MDIERLAGWYSTGAQPEKADKELHKKIQEVWRLSMGCWDDVRWRSIALKKSINL